MKDLTLSFTIIIKGCMTKNMTPEQIAEQLNEHVQHEVKDSAKAYITSKVDRLNGHYHGDNYYIKLNDVLKAIDDYS